MYESIYLIKNSKPALYNKTNLLFKFMFNLLMKIQTYPYKPISP